MPQLDILTYMTQLVWLFIILGTFYVILVTRVLPSIKSVMRARTLIKNTEEESKKLELGDNKVIAESIEITNKIAKEEEKINNRMIHENIAQINNKEMINANRLYLDSVANLLIEKNE